MEVETRRLKEGSWFRIDLKAGHAIGVIARVGKKKRRPIVVSYLFLGTGAAPEDIDESMYQADGADLACRCDSSKLETGEWPILSVPSQWSRNEWPMPLFVRFGGTPQNFVTLVRFDDRDPMERVSEQVVSIAECNEVPAEDLYGSVALEIKLESMLEVRSCE